MKWLMLIAVVLLAVQFVACEDEEKIAQLESEKESLNEDIGELKEDTATIDDNLKLLKQFPEVAALTGESVPTPKPEETEEAEEVTQDDGLRMRVVVDALNVRDDPTTGGEKVALLEKGEIVDVLERQGDWALVRTPSGAKGWACVKLDGEVFLREEQ